MTYLSEDQYYALHEEIISLRQEIIRLKQEKESLNIPVDRQKALFRVISKIRESLELEIIFKSTAVEVRQLLNADRVGMYCFKTESQYEFGEFVSEDVLPPYTPALFVPIQDHCFGRRYRELYTKGKIWACNDIHNAGLQKCYTETLDQFQIKANLVVPLLKGDHLWGLLCIHQCSAPRIWNENDIEFVSQIATHLGIALQQSESLQQLQDQSYHLTQAVNQAVEREQAIATIIDKIRRSLDLNTIFSTTTHEVRHLLNADRVVIYRFHEDWSGQFVVESLKDKWDFISQKHNPQTNCYLDHFSLKDLATLPIEDTYIKETQGTIFDSYQPYRICTDIENAGFSECYLEVLRDYHVKAYAIIAIYQGKKLWGLLAVYQNDQTRIWQDSEVQFLVQIGAQLGVAIQQAELLDKEQQRSQSLQTTLEKQLRRRADELAQEAQQERALAEVIDKIRQTLDLTTIFEIATKEVRQLLNADRTAVFQLDQDRNYQFGEFVSEDVLGDYQSVLHNEVQDHCFSSGFVDDYEKGKILALSNIDTAPISGCHHKILQHFKIKANLVVPLIKGGKLWGLLCIHQCSTPRQWQPKEIEFVSKIAIQLGVALQQAELLVQAKKRSEELQTALAQVEAQNEQQRTLAQIIDRIRQTLDMETIFSATTHEVREVLDCDRVVVYRFFPDWKGEFVYESVSNGWIPLSKGNIKSAWIDSHLEETQGGRYRHHEYLVVNNIYEAGHVSCHIAMLEIFQVKSYMVVPVFVGDKLWGLLSAYHNREYRTWIDREVRLLLQVANQLGVGLYQAELLAQTKRQSRELRETLADLNAIVDNLADGLLVADTQNYITRFNPALKHLFNMQNVNLKNQPLQDLFPEELVNLIQNTHHQDQKVVTAEVTLPQNRIGQALATTILKEAELDEGDQCLGSVILIRDVTHEREVDRMKTEFIATVSHELRTPLTSVLGFASIIQNKLEAIIAPALNQSDQKTQKTIQKILSNIEIIVTEAERLTSLINDVLDIAKMESGRVNWNFQPNNLKQIVDQAIAATSSLISLKGLSLVEEIPSHLPSVIVDKNRIIQVLINLISNAIKFTPKGTITCRIEIHHKEIVIQIKDTGIGISPEHQDKVFEKFHQVGDILTDKPKGTGLGLPICKQIIEHHGGKIWVTSQPNKGSTFAFSLPK